MTAPNLDLPTDDPQELQDDSAPIDTQPSTEQLSPQTPAVPEIDYRALYLEGVRQRGMLEAQLQQNVVPQQSSAPEEITDDHIEKYGTVNTIRKLLKQELADVGEISQDFKRTKAIEKAEQQFFATVPHYAQYSEAIKSTVRPMLQGQQNIDANAYSNAFYVALGRLAEQQAFSNPATPPVSTNNAQPPRQSVPTGRTNGAPVSSSAVPRLSEMERTAIRRAGYDPNKSDDVKKFFAEIDNDEGITV